MLSAEENELLTRIGPGTKMGGLLRRYWQPVAGAAEMEDRWNLRVRILGEDLVLFKTRKGNFGLIAEQCPHRRASLANGVPTEEGIRCHPKPREKGKDMYSDGFVSHLRRQMSNFSPIIDDLIAVFTKDGGNKPKPHQTAPTAQ